LSRLAVFTALPVPAQLIRMRSWPLAARALAKAGVHLRLVGHVDGAEYAAELFDQAFGPLLLAIKVEDRHLNAMARQQARRRFAQPGGAARDHRRNRVVELHERLPEFNRYARVRAARASRKGLAAMSDDAQRRPYGSFDPRSVIDPSKALVPSTVRVNEVRVKTGFWPKIRGVAGARALRQGALSAYYLARDPETPLRTKGIIYGALAYFVLPTDAIPDVIAGLGFTDDAAVLMTLMTCSERPIKPKHKAKADVALEKLKAED
jgi:uncharacterized membrane protein YkvA (DUF1232 family)